MASFTNQTKNTSTFTNQQKTANANVTFSEVDSSWGETPGTFEKSLTGWKNQTKNTSTFTNQTKN